MVDDDIRHHLGTTVMERSNQLLQIATATPVAVLVAILLGVVTGTTGIA